MDQVREKLIAFFKAPAPQDLHLYDLTPFDEEFCGKNAQFLFKLCTGLVNASTLGDPLFKRLQINVDDLSDMMMLTRGIGAVGKMTFGKEQIDKCCKFPDSLRVISLYFAKKAEVFGNAGDSTSHQVKHFRLIHQHVLICADELERCLSHLYKPRAKLLHFAHESCSP